jgi:carbon-monoxide dehydrogenase small subunit
MAEKIRLDLTVNGLDYGVDVYPATRLVDVLRQELKLTGTKEGCGEGECGACAVILNGRLVNSCLVPAAQAQGAEITTVEGLNQGDTLGELQKSFHHHNGAQCGFCTPGFLVASADLLSREPKPDEETVRRALSGNLCRCTGYVKIVDAVMDASRKDG